MERVEVKLDDEVVVPIIEEGVVFVFESHILSSKRDIECGVTGKRVKLAWRVKKLRDGELEQEMVASYKFINSLSANSLPIVDEGYDLMVRFTNSKVHNWLGLVNNARKVRGQEPFIIREAIV